jgi:hypothetical protein
MINNQYNHPLFLTWYQSLGFDPITTLILHCAFPGRINLYSRGDKKNFTVAVSQLFPAVFSYLRSPSIPWDSVQMPSSDRPRGFVSSWQASCQQGSAAIAARLQIEDSPGANHHGIVHSHRHPVFFRWDIFPLIGTCWVVLLPGHMGPIYMAAFTFFLLYYSG